MNKKGFSLIEVLVGLVLLAIGLLAIAGMQITSVIYRYQFECKQGDSDPHSRMGCGKNEVVEGSFLRLSLTPLCSPLN